MSRTIMYSKIDGWEGNANFAQNLALSFGVLSPKFTKGIASWLDVNIAFHYWSNKVLQSRAR